MDFKEDLNIGEGVEIRFAEKLVELGRHKVIHKALGNFKGYDLLGDLTTTYEVKFDRMAKKTGNMAFEYRFRGAKSGLASTEAQYWVQYDGVYYFVFLTAALKDWLRMHMEKGNLRRPPNCGDGSECVLVPSASFASQTFCEMIPDDRSR